MNNLQKFVQQLKSTDPAARRDAIIALGKAGNAAAIRPLTEISENDLDPTLREFARKAILHIKKVQSQPAQAVDVPPAQARSPVSSGLIEEPSDDLIGLPSEPPTFPRQVVASEEIARLVVDELSKHRDPKEVVSIVCEKTGMDWKEAERLVVRVQDENRGEIIGRRAQTYRVMTLVSIILGPLGVLAAIVMTLQGTIIWLIQLSVPPVAIPLNLVVFLVGLSMSAGGVTGIMRGVLKVPPKATGTEKMVAKGHLEHALGLRVSGENEKAFILLTEALRYDRKLATQPTAMNLASVLLNKPPKEAIEIVLQRSQDERTRPKEGVGSGMRSLSVDKQVWDFALEAAILLVILILFSVVLNFGVVRMLNSLMSSLQLSTQLSAERAAELQSQADLVRSQINAISPTDLIFTAMKDGAILLFVILLGNSITYGVGTLLGGTGLVFRFLSTMARVQIVTYFAVGAVLAFALFIDIQNSTAKNSSTAFVWIGAIMIIVSGFLSFVAHVYFAGRAHEMSFAKGFLAVVVGGLISSFLIQVLGVFK